MLINYRRISFILILFLTAVTIANAQSSARGTSGRDTTEREPDLSSSAELNRNTMLARSSADYRVTPGDVYTLSFTAGTNPVVYVISVDATYRIRVANLGVVNGDGKTFMQIKNEVENIVTRNFPLSGVQLVLTQPAVFKVFVTGEVKQAGEVTTWGLNRLSSLIDVNLAEIIDIITAENILTTSNLTEYTSIRNINVRSSNGQERVYDLFRAQRLGDLSHDPYLRPGDIVTFNRIDRSAIINGAVERPGRYQLLRGENLRELINVYASGFIPQADPTRIELTRYVNSESVTGNLLYVTEDDLEKNFGLEHMDSVFVPSIADLTSVVFVEGAVSSLIDDDGVATSNRLVVRFITGETYASLARKNIHWFSEISDTQNAYILRNEERIPINLNLALYDASFRGAVSVMDNDILVIPFRQYFISVSGSVINPGRFPYIPDRNWEYYIGLAGGFITNQNRRSSVTILDINGNRMTKNDLITPETTIIANTNHLIYYFNQYGTVLTTVLSVVSTLISIILITR